MALVQPENNSQKDEFHELLTAVIGDAFIIERYDYWISNNHYGPKAELSIRLRVSIADYLRRYQASALYISDDALRIGPYSPDSIQRFQEPQSAHYVMDVVYRVHDFQDFEGHLKKKVHDKFDTEFTEQLESKLD